MDYKEKILIIEDEDIFRKTLINALKKENYEVFDAGDANQALALSSDRVFDIIVSDVRLSGNVDGIEVVNMIKGKNTDSRTMVIIMTGFAGEEAPVRAIKVGVDDYIFKPFEIDAFLKAIKNLCRILKYERLEKEYTEQLKIMRDKVARHNDELKDKLNEETNKLKLLFETSNEFSTSYKLDKVLSMIVERISQLLQLDRCSVLLLDKKNNELYIAASKGLPKKVLNNTRIKVGDKISGWVLKNQEAVLVKDIEADPRFSKTNEEKYYTGSFMSVPLVCQDKTIGIINVNNKKSRENFNEDDFNFIKSIAEQASIAIENARLYSSIEDMYLQITSSFTSIIDAKDHYTKNHSFRVSQYAKAIAEKMGLAVTDINYVVLACQLHDLGKIGVSELILNKPEKLTDDEMEEIRAHPIKGANMLRPLPFLNDIRLMIEQHHESFDGTGYPYGLKGEEISIGARIINVADSFDAMLTARPYCKGRTFKAAIDELKRCRGKQFDPKVVDAFIELLEDPSLSRKWETIIS